MAGFAIGELLMVLMMGGLLPTDVDPLPVDQVLAGLPADCEVVAFQDFRGSFPAIQALVADLSTQPWLVSNPEAAEGMREVSTQLSSMPAMATAQLGVDPFTAFHSAALCARLGTNPTGEPAPSFIAILQGDFPQTLATSLSAAIGLGPATLSNGTAAFGEREDGVLFAMISPAPGVLLFGTEDLLLPRAVGALSREWETAAADTLVGRVRNLAAGGPRTILAFAPSAGTRFLLGSEAPVTFSQLVAGLDRAVFVSSGTTAYLETRAASPDAFRDHELIVGGLGETILASSHAARGLTHLVLGLLSPDDMDLDEPLRMIVSHRDELLTFLEGMGLFADTEVAFNSDAATQTNTLTMTNATGGLAAMGFILGGMAAYMLTARSPYDEYDYGPPTEAPAMMPPTTTAPGP